MSSLQTNKNLQSSISSATFVGLTAEHCHFTELYASKIVSDLGIDVLDTINTLQEQLTELQQKLETLALNDLTDVNVSGVSQGDTLIFKNGAWQPAELLGGETVDNDET